MRNAEWGMKRRPVPGGRATAEDVFSFFRIPHSAFRIPTGGLSRWLKLPSIPRPSAIRRRPRPDRSSACPVRRGAEPYRPLSLLAVAGFSLAVLYAASVTVGGLALFATRHLTAAILLLVLAPAAGALTAVLRREPAHHRRLHRRGRWRWLPRSWGWAAWSPTPAAVRGCCPGTGSCGWCSSRQS